MRKILLFFPFICLCCALAAASAQISMGYRGHYGYGEGSGAGEVPAGGDCANTGSVFPDNPFHGWPTDYQPGNWSNVTFFFCARYPDGSPHWGIDIGVPNGAKALATCERCVVVQANDCNGEPQCWNFGMGRFVQVEAQVRVPNYDQCVADHGGDPQAPECWVASGWKATYMHLQEIRVRVGQIVFRGQELGTTDNSGNSTGPHLHYQINSPSGAVDPAPTMQ